MATKYGRQPFLDLITKPLTYRGVASEIGVPYLHLRNAGYGYVRPKIELREGLVSRFGVDVEKLFTEAALTTAPHYGDKARRLMAEAKAEHDFLREETPVDPFHGVDLPEAS